MHLYVLIISLLLPASTLSNPGGITPVDINDPQVQVALKFAVNEYNMMINCAFWVIEESVANVTEQVVAGMLFRFYGVVFVPTVCRKMAPFDPKNCPVAEHPTRTTCDFQVLLGIKDKKELSHLDCKH
ncbi:cystatin-like [Physella acuta]|uniref:cystatin-like n=1 Tax=Physella acuta TaxID=109671 RepID=UPI0027DDD6A6|nr:cystatin-like [Physella acuta]